MTTQDEHLFQVLAMDYGDTQDGALDTLDWQVSPALRDALLAWYRERKHSQTCSNSDRSMSDE